MKVYNEKIFEVSCAMKLVIIDSGVNFTDNQKRYLLIAVFKLITASSWHLSGLPGVAVLDHLINQDLWFLSNTVAINFTSIHAMVTM